jgi:hypothetical protein
MENKKIKKESHSLITNDSGNKDENTENDRNMKLPFEY